MDTELAKSLAKIFAKDFIARPEIMAVQTADGEYRPTRDTRTKEIHEGFSMAALVSHLQGERTLGHYMTSAEDRVKLFALDIDLNTTGQLPQGKFGANYINWQPCDPRAAWMSRKQGAGRDITKYQMRMIGHQFARIIHDELGIRVAVAYSGSKGLHVYGFTGPTTAERARRGARIVIEMAGWTLSRGQNIFSPPPNPDDLDNDFSNFNIEIYPKQDSVEGKDLGNLMRLPLGVNLKSPKDRAFFVDLRSAMTDLRPMDPFEALTTADPWRYSGE